MVSLAGCEKPSPALKVVLVAEEPGVALEDSTTLLIALPVEITGSDSVTRVRVNRIDLDSARRISPATLPVPVAGMSAGNRPIVNASFDASRLTPDKSYRLTIAGIYTANGRDTDFSLTHQVALPVRAPGQATLGQGQAKAVSVRGAPYRHRDIVISKDVNRPGPPPAQGRQRGTIRPAGNASMIDTSHATGSTRAKHVLYQANDMVMVRNTAMAGGGGVPNDPSGASGGLQDSGVVLVTGNTYASFSANGGQTFVRLDPTTIFPDFDATGKMIDGGLCCDQVVHYDALANRFYWLMQFWAGPDGSSRLRLAAASPEALVASGGTAWSYWDLTSALVGQTGNMFDYPDLSVGDHFLYASADIGGGLMVFRIPLSEISAGGTINFGYTDPKKGVSAYGRHLIQNPADQLFWAGSPSTSSLRVFSMAEGSNKYSWKDIDINSYPFGDFVSNSPDGSNWLSSVFSGGPGGVRLRTASADEIWFEWMAGRGGGFPQPHIQYIRLNRSNLSVIGQSQIWNNTLAFNYASFTAVNGKIGAVVAFGGAADYGTPAVGIMGDGVFYAPCSSSANLSRYGDYLTVRQAWPNMYLFSATVYCVGTGGTFDQRYVLFGRSVDENPVQVGTNSYTKTRASYDREARPNNP